MNGVLLALAPIFSLIALGYFLKRINIPGENFWDLADKITYYILFPSLLIYKLANANLSGINGFDIVLSAIISISVLALFLMFLDKFMLFFKEEAFTSIFQGSTRFNTYVFLALITSLYGDEGLIIAALIMTFTIPFLNFICIGIFALYNEEQKVNFKSFVLAVIKNPLIIACIIGGSLNFFSITLLPFINEILSITSMIALPLGLLSVGVGLHIRSMGEVKLELLTSLFFKLALLPAIMIFVALKFELSFLAIAVLMIYASMPTAPSSYILARQLGGDTKLMSAIITIQTLVSVFTITIIASMLDSYVKM